MVRSASPGCRGRMARRAPVEPDALHRRVVDEPGRVPFQGAGQRGPVPLVQDQAGGHGRPHHQDRGGLRAHRGGQPPGVGLPAGRGGHSGDEPGHAARQPDPVDQPGVDGVTEHHLLAGLDGGQQRVEYPVQAARDTDALGNRVVGAAREPADVGRGRLAQRRVPLERQIAVGRVVVDGHPGRVQGDLRRPQVGVQVLQAQDVRVRGRVGGVTDHVHADAGNLPEPRHGHDGQPRPAPRRAVAEAGPAGGADAFRAFRCIRSVEAAAGPGSDRLDEPDRSVCQRRSHRPVAAGGAWRSLPPAHHSAPVWGVVTHARRRR